MGFVEDKLDGALGKLAETFTQESEKTRLTFAQAMAESIRASRATAAIPRPLVAGLVYGGSARLLGLTARETAGQPVTIDLYDTANGTTAPERLVATVTVPANGPVALALPGDGVSVTEALWAVVTGTGTALGAVLVGP